MLATLEYKLFHVFYIKCGTSICSEDWGWQYWWGGNLATSLRVTICHAVLISCCFWKNWLLLGPNYIVIAILFHYIFFLDKIIVRHGNVTGGLWLFFALFTFLSRKLFLLFMLLVYISHVMICFHFSIQWKWFCVALYIKGIELEGPLTWALVIT